MQGYLLSRANVLGVVLALAGLLFASGSAIENNAVMAVGMYVFGVVLGVRQPWLMPSLKAQPPRAVETESPATRSEDIGGSLQQLVERVRTLVPDDVMTKVLHIQDIVAGILSRAEGLTPGSPELGIVRATVLDYLPTALDAYLNLPNAFARFRPIADGKTAHAILLEQLALLDGELAEIADDLNRNDADRLVIHGRFLAEKFADSPLELETKK